MILRFKQRLFSWLDSYDVYDEFDNVYFRVEGKLSFGHEFHVYDKNDNYVAKLKQGLFTLLPKFHIYDSNDNKVGTITKEFTFFKPSFTIDMNGWSIDGNLFEWDYSIFDGEEEIATITKELFHFTDHYAINVRERDALNALLVVLAIDAVKCSKERSR